LALKLKTLSLIKNFKNYWYTQKKTPFTDTNMNEIYCPQGRYLHIPPEYPEPGFDTSIFCEFFEQDSIYKIFPKTRQAMSCAVLIEQSMLFKFTVIL